MSEFKVDGPDVLMPDKETSKSEAKEKLMQEAALEETTITGSKCNIPAKRKLSVEGSQNSPPRKRSAMLTTAWDVEVGNSTDVSPALSLEPSILNKTTDILNVTTITLSSICLANSTESHSPIATSTSSNICSPSTTTTTTRNSDSLDSMTTNTSVVNSAAATTTSLPPQLPNIVSSQTTQNADSLESMTTNTSVVDKATTKTAAPPSQSLAADTYQSMYTSDLTGATVSATTGLPSQLLATVASQSMQHCKSDSPDSMIKNTSVAAKATIARTDLPSVLLATEISKLVSHKDIQIQTPNPISAEKNDTDNSNNDNALPSQLLATVSSQSMQDCNSDSVDSMAASTSVAGKETVSTTALPFVLPPTETSQLVSLDLLPLNPISPEEKKTDPTAREYDNATTPISTEEPELKNTVKICSITSPVSLIRNPAITPVGSGMNHTTIESLSENESLSTLTSDLIAAEDSDTEGKKSKSQPLEPDVLFTKLPNCNASESSTRVKLYMTASSKIPLTVTDKKLFKLPTKILVASSATNSAAMNKQLSITSSWLSPASSSENPSETKPSLSVQASFTNSMAAQPKSQSLIKRNNDGNKAVITSIFIPRNYSTLKCVDDKSKTTNTSSDPNEHTFKMIPSNLALVPILSPSYLKSLTSYIMTAKNFTTLSDGKSKEPLVAEKVVKSLIKRVEDIQKGIIDPNEAAKRDAYTQTEKSFVALQRKISLLRSNIKKKSAEITSLRGATKLLTPTNVVVDKLKGITKIN